MKSSCAARAGRRRQCRFGLYESTASTLLVGIGIGSIVGVLIADWLIERGHIAVRITIAAAAFLIAAGLFLPGLLITSPITHS